jgi:hypothetical protein
VMQVIFSLVQIVPSMILAATYPLDSYFPCNIYAVKGMNPAGR